MTPRGHNTSQTKKGPRMRARRTGSPKCGHNEAVGVMDETGSESREGYPLLE